MKKDKLNNDTPKLLQELKQKEGMTIPDGYFDELHSNMMDRLDDNSAKVKKFSMRRILAYAASMAFIIMSMYFIFQEPTTTDIKSYVMDINEYDDDEILYEELTVNDYYDELASVDLALEDEIEF